MLVIYRFSESAQAPVPSTMKKPSMTPFSSAATDVPMLSDRNAIGKTCLGTNI